MNSFSAPSASLSLTGKTILVTRSAGQSSQFTRLLQTQGATVIEMPALEIGPPSSWEPLDAAIAHLSEFDWLILTSTNGVDYFCDRLATQGKTTEALTEIHIAVVGQKTAARLHQQGIQPDFIPPNFVADSLVEHFPDRDRLEELKILFPRVETGGREVLVKELTARGATVVEVPAYESGCVKAIDPQVAKALVQGTLDIITFASSKTVTCFCQLMQQMDKQLIIGQPQDVAEWQSPLSFMLKNICIASIGPQTSARCAELLGRVDLEAKDYTLEGLMRAIVEWTITQGQASEFDRRRAVEQG